MAADAADVGAGVDLAHEAFQDAGAQFGAAEAGQGRADGGVEAGEGVRAGRCQVGVGGGQLRGRGRGRPAALPSATLEKINSRSIPILATTANLPPGTPHSLTSRPLR
jgi:hypothetical protein